MVADQEALPPYSSTARDLVGLRLEDQQHIRRPASRRLSLPSSPHDHPGEGRAVPKSAKQVGPAPFSALQHDPPYDLHSGVLTAVQHLGSSFDFRLSLPRGNNRTARGEACKEVVVGNTGGGGVDQNYVKL